MSHALVIAGRELAEKRFVFFAAAAFALLAVLLPLVPGVNGSPRDVIAVTSMILTAGFTLGVAGILGATIVGRDLSAGRLSFYFARPVAATSIWFGKLAAAAALVVASFAIVILPAVIATGGQLTHALTMNFGRLAAIVIAGAVAFFFVAHALSTMIRSRSVLIGLDFAAAIATGAILWQLARPLLATYFALRLLLQGFGASAFVAFIAAGAWQLADGRADRRRSHAAFSKALWIGLAAALLLVGGYTAWIVSASPRDITQLAYVEPSPHGDWLIVSGITRHRLDFQPAFLINVATGAARHIAAGRNAIFSADGSKVLDVQRQYKETEVVVTDTATGRTTETGITFKAMSSYPIVTTADLSRFASFNIENNILTVYDVAARRSVGSTRLSAFPTYFYFVSPDVVRCYAVWSNRIDAFEFDAAHHALKKTGSIKTRQGWLQVTADGTRAMTREPHAASLVVRDARTLEPLANVPLPSAESRFYVLRDGRIVTTDGHTLRVSGTPLAVDLGGPPLVLTDIGGGKVAVAFYKGGVAVVDVDRGAIVRREFGRSPALRYSTDHDPRPLQWSPNLIVGRGRGGGGSVLRWNALTGETKVLVPG